MGSGEKLTQAVAALLFFQAVFQFAGIREGHCFARPGEGPRSPVFGPTAEAVVVLLKAEGDVLGKADVEAPRRVFYDIDSIAHRE